MPGLFDELGYFPPHRSEPSVFSKKNLPGVRRVFSKGLLVEHIVVFGVFAYRRSIVFG